MKNKSHLNQATLLAATLIILAPALCAQSTSSNSPLLNSIATPRPFDPGTNTTNPSALAVQAQNPYLGSVPTRPLTPGVLPLSLTEAVDFGLKANLGLIDTEQEHVQSPRGENARPLGAAASTERRTGEHVSQLPAQHHRRAELGLPNMIGNFNYQTADIALQQKVLDISALHEIKASHAERR